MPSLQNSQNSDPFTAVNFPFSHGMHSLFGLLLSVVYDPGPHCLHDVDAKPSEKLPA